MHVADLITRAELLEALDKVVDRARMYGHGEYDSVKRVLYEAKAEVCEELKVLLTPPMPSIAAQSRARLYRETEPGVLVYQCASTRGFECDCPGTVCKARSR